MAKFTVNSYRFDPYRNFDCVLSAGAGKYGISQVGGYYVANGENVPSEIDAHKTLGLVLGAGFNFRFFQSRLLLHKTATEFPAFLEWSMGLKLSLFKMRA